MCKANSAVHVRIIPPHGSSIALPRTAMIVLLCRQDGTTVLDCGTRDGRMSLTFMSFRRGPMVGSRRDPKVEALRAERSLNPPPRGRHRRGVREFGVLRRPRPGAGEVRDGPQGAGGRGGGDPGGLEAPPPSDP